MNLWRSTQSKPGVRVIKLNRDVWFAAIMKTVLYSGFIMSAWELKGLPRANGSVRIVANQSISQREADNGRRPI